MMHVEVRESMQKTRQTQSPYVEAVRSRNQNVQFWDRAPVWVNIGNSGALPADTALTVILQAPGRVRDTELASWFLS